MNSSSGLKLGEMIKRFALKAILIGITAAMLFKKLNGSPINEPCLSVLVGSVNVVYPDLNECVQNTYPYAM